MNLFFFACVATRARAGVPCVSVLCVCVYRRCCGCADGFAEREFWVRLPSNWNARLACGRKDDWRRGEGSAPASAGPQARGKGRREVLPLSPTLLGWGGTAPFQGDWILGVTTGWGGGFKTGGGGCTDVPPNKPPAHRPVPHPRAHPPPPPQWPETASHIAPHPSPQSAPSGMLRITHPPKPSTSSLEGPRAWRSPPCGCRAGSCAQTRPPSKTWPRRSRQCQSRCRPGQSF